MYSLLIKNGTIVDGTGKKSFEADLAIEGDTIVAIDKNIPEKAHQIIDAKGKIVSPGFVDIQNHSDSYWTIFDNPAFESLLTQGITSIVIGQCGASLAPLLSREALLSVRKWHDLDGSNINWSSFPEYMEELSRRRFGCNIATMVGYGTLRRGLLGDEIRGLEKEEIDSLKQQLRIALEAGSFGLTSGLAYSHEVIISELELFDLAQLLKEYNALFSIHLRSESQAVVESVEEALDIARHTDVNLKISHLKVRHRQNWHLLPQVIERLEHAFHRGSNVHYDVYPYDSIWQVAYNYLPQWVSAGGRSAMETRLAEPELRRKLLAELAEQSTTLQNLVIASTSHQMGMVGKRISDIAKNTGVTSEEIFLDLIKNGGTESLVFDECLQNSDVATLATHPLAIIATDGAGFSATPKRSIGFGERLVHPRCFGTVQRFLAMANATNHLPLEEQIKKLTSLPAGKIGLAKRGSLAVGNFADCVIFDPTRMHDNATLTNPFQYSSGIDYVFVNGAPAVVDGLVTEQRYGITLKKR